MKPGPIDSIASLLAHAHALEAEASERYGDLARVVAKSCPELSEFFAKMAAIEMKHVDAVEEMAGELELPQFAHWEFSWSDMEGPETTPLGMMAQLVSPRAGILQAIDNEERAVRFFDDVAEVTSDSAVREMARTLAEEEREHVAILHGWLTRYPEEEEGAAADGRPSDSET